MRHESVSPPSVKVRDLLRSHAADRHGDRWSGEGEPQAGDETESPDWALAVRHPGQEQRDASARKNKGNHTREPRERAQQPKGDGAAQGGRRTTGGGSRQDDGDGGENVQ